MHILGKILVWMLVLAAGASAALLSRQLQIRNSYAKKLRLRRNVDLQKANPSDLSLREQVAKNREVIASKKAEIDRLEADLDQALIGWQKMWDNRQARARRDANGRQTLGIDAGTDEGLGAEVNDPKANLKVRKNTVFHVFRRLNPAQPDSVYVGRFKLDPTNQQSIGPAGVTAYPDWDLRHIDWKLMGGEQSRQFPQLKTMLDNLEQARLDLRNKQVQLKIAKETEADAAEIARLQGEVSTAQMRIAGLERQAMDAGWNLMDGLGPVLRIWARLPGAKSDAFSNLYFRLAGLDRKYEAAEEELISSQKALAVASARVEELEQQIAGQDGTGGFVLQLRNAEDERNTVLGKVDELRRTLKTLIDKRDALLKENASIVNNISKS